MTTPVRTGPVKPRDAVSAAFVDAPLARLLGVLVDALDPLEIWLFGSRAERRAREESDYDVLVVVRDDAPAEAFDSRRAFYLAESADIITADVIALTISEFNDDKDLLDTLARAAWLRGKCLYQRRGAHRRLPQDE
jgi:predicted nucleotidyltransferase